MKVRISSDDRYSDLVLKLSVLDLIEWDGDDGFTILMFPMHEGCKAPEKGKSEIVKYIHSPFCNSGCRYDCLGAEGFKLARKFNQLRIDDN